MNFKLLTFILVVIGVQSIDSSIINKSSIDNLVQISNLNNEVISSDNPFSRIKSLTFNISDTVVQSKLPFSLILDNLFNFLILLIRRHRISRSYMS